MINHFRVFRIRFFYRGLRECLGRISRILIFIALFATIAFENFFIRTNPLVFF